MMPKGVEHPEQFVTVPAICLVSLPMMPKGVEHRKMSKTTKVTKHL